MFIISLRFFLFTLFFKMLTLNPLIWWWVNFIIYSIAWEIYRICFRYFCSGCFHPLCSCVFSSSPKQFLAPNFENYGETIVMCVMFLTIRCFFTPPTPNALTILAEFVGSNNKSDHEMPAGLKCLKKRIISFPKTDFHQSVFPKCV